VTQRFLWLESTKSWFDSDLKGLRLDKYDSGTSLLTSHEFQPKKHLLGIRSAIKLHKVLNTTESCMHVEWKMKIRLGTNKLSTLLRFQSKALWGPIFFVSIICQTRSTPGNPTHFNGSQEKRNTQRQQSEPYPGNNLQLPVVLAYYLRNALWVASLLASSLVSWKLFR